jgi:hypothetical protein
MAFSRTGTTVPTVSDQMPSPGTSAAGMLLLSDTVSLCLPSGCKSKAEGAPPNSFREVHVVAQVLLPATWSRSGHSVGLQFGKGRGESLSRLTRHSSSEGTGWVADALRSMTRWRLASLPAHARWPGAGVWPPTGERAQAGKDLPAAISVPFFCTDLGTGAAAGGNCGAAHFAERSDRAINPPRDLRGS